MAEDGRIFIGVDLGGTKIQAAAVRGGEVLASAKKKTKAGRGADAVLDRVEKVVRAVLDGLHGAARDAVAGVCVGAPGAVDTDSGVVIHAPNLDWHGVPLGERLGKTLDLPVFVDNDVNIGLVGEHVHGAARGARHVAAVFVGTGIGGAVILDGKPYYGSRSSAGEFGHIVVEAGGRTCGCGRKGCVEAYASKTAMEAMVRQKAERGRDTIVPRLLDDKGGRMTSSVIAEALERDDAVMNKVIETAQYYLGLLTSNLVNTLDPEAIVFGGGLVERLGAPFLEPVIRTARSHYLNRDGAERIRIVPAALGDHAGPVGAAVIAGRRLQQAVSP